MTLRAAPAALLLLPAGGHAHSFGVVYTLPVPFWLYAWGATAALIASFLVVGYFVSHAGASPVPSAARKSLDISQSRPVHIARRLHLLTLAKALSVASLLLCIATGLWGTQRPYDNINMTLFWIVFVLGFSYLTALIGNLYDAINPWKVLTGAIGRSCKRYDKGLLRYPERLAYWPALLLYMGFIWIELLGNTKPASLAYWLLLYTAINLAGAGLIGRRDWFRYCEFFAVFLRLIALLAPVDYRAREGNTPGHLRLRKPFSGVLEAPTPPFSLLVFMLFMLSSTAFDGLHETVIWKKVFWRDLYLSHLQYYTSQNPLAAIPQMSQLFKYWQSAWLLLSPGIYLLVYGLFIALTRWLTRTPRSVRELSLAFAFSLLPIALVYHISHYYTLIETQGIKVIRLLSDPFGAGHNLFGTAGWLRRSFIPDVTVVWHTQVILIVLGHIVSVYLAHRVALRLFPTRKQAVLSQLPMLVLMVAFTTAGLWILSKPVGS